VLTKKIAMMNTFKASMMKSFSVYKNDENERKLAHEIDLIHKSIQKYVEEKTSHVCEDSPTPNTN